MNMQKHALIIVLIMATILICSFTEKSFARVSFTPPSSNPPSGKTVPPIPTHGMEKVNNYYLNLNKKGGLYSWSFVKDNILVVITGAIPEKKARQLESALNDIKK